MARELPPIDPSLDRDSDEYVFFTGSRGYNHYYRGVKYVPEENMDPPRKGCVRVWEVTAFISSGERKGPTSIGMFKTQPEAMAHAVELKVEHRSNWAIKVQARLAIELEAGVFHRVDFNPIRWGLSPTIENYL